MEGNNNDLSKYMNYANYKDDVINYISKNDYKDSVYMISLYNLRTKLAKAFGEEKLMNNLDEMEKKVFTVNGRVLSDEDRISLEMLRVRNVELEGREYEDIARDIINEITRVMTLKDWNNPAVISYIKEQILFLQILMKLDITFISVIDSLFKKEINKFNSNSRVRGIKSEMSKHE